ncbi:MAG: arsenosugar biosynthesis radical SAM protein ArsS [Cyclobacteriaceae bacterium]|nr:arsenosugar biosynthesis radical SAM protein ArsS [Cyclobacteriaceae bacterium]
MIKSLKVRNHNLSEAKNQIELLNNYPFKTGVLPSFQEKLENMGIRALKPTGVDIFQVNVGYMCNQTCKHCHVDAGPDRKEIMTRETMDHCLSYIRKNKVSTVDITGGAPEMNPDFEWFVKEIKKLGVPEIIVRSNLTILRSNKKYHHLPQLFADLGIRVVSSLPFYNADRTDRQRGQGVFTKSIEALQELNKVGYGRREGLIIDLVYNPSGAFLPADQASLEFDFKRELKEHFELDFNNLLTITNLPISRFLDYLIESENYEEYMETLVTAFNPATVPGLMCTNTLSVGWDGVLYDCDFNQMLKLPVNAIVKNIVALESDEINDRHIVVGQHCYGCTAGAGSSCQGSVV